MNSRHPGRPPRTEPWPKCKVAECTRTTEGGSKGFCHTHYIFTRRGIIDVETGQRLREPERISSYGPGALCTVEDCGRRPVGNGLCNAHFLRQKNGLPMDAPVRPRTMDESASCLVTNCEERATSKGMCSGHAEQRRRGLLDDAGNKLREPYSMGRGRPRKTDKWLQADGYVLVQAPESHPHARVDGSILEHRLVMEKRLGRYLEEWELVHHKDGIRFNNAEDNLELLDGRARKGEGHPPGHEFDPITAAQVLTQQEDLPESLKQQLHLFLTARQMGKA